MELQERVAAILFRVESAKIDNAALIAETMARGQGIAGLAMAAIIRVKGVVDWKRPEVWSEQMRPDEKSDLIFQTRLFLDPYLEDRDYGLHPQRMEAARRIFFEYCEQAADLMREFPEQKGFDEIVLLPAIREAMKDQLYVRSYISDNSKRNDYYSDRTYHSRVLIRTSVLHKRNVKLILGVPGTIPAPDWDFDKDEADVVLFATEVDIVWARKHYPEACCKDEPMYRSHRGEVYTYDPAKDQCFGTVETRVYNDVVLTDQNAPIPSTENEAREEFIRWLISMTEGSGPPYGVLTAPRHELVNHNWAQAQRVKHDHPELSSALDRWIRQWYEDKAQKAARFADLEDIQVLRFPVADEIVKMLPKPKPRAKAQTSPSHRRSPLVTDGGFGVSGSGERCWSASSGSGGGFNTLADRFPQRAKKD